MVNTGGNGVSGESGPITVPGSVSQQNLEISPEGRIFAGGVAIGKIKVVTVEDTGELEQIGGGSFKAGGAAVTEALDYGVHQGFQESSNVTTVSELVDLITVTRLYEANIKSIQAHDDRMKSLLQVALG